MERPIGKTLADVVEEKTRTAPDHPAILFQDRSISYRELLERTTEAAKALVALDVKAGDRVGALLGNDPYWVIMALASSMIGACFVPLNTWYKKSELAWTIRHCGLSVIVCARQFLKTDYGRLFAELIPHLDRSAPGDLRAPDWPELRALVFIGEPPRGGLDWSTFLQRGTSIAAETLQAARAGVRPDATAFVLYTSGSMAEPKGVMLTHRGVVENGFDLGQRRGVIAGDRVWLGTPLFYALGATNALPATLTAGATLVLQGSFDAGSAIAVIQRTAATVYYGTGNMTRAIVDHPDYAQRRIGSLKKGNAGIVAEYKRLTLVKMGISGAVPAYGLTETYGNATVGLPDDPLEIKLHTNGRALPGMKLVIVDPTTGAPMKRGETGLVLVRGYTTPGYLNNPAETGKALRSDGFFDTGDLGSLDDEDRMIFHARLKDVIKSGGINISPVEVEQLLASHPDVRDAYVVGVADAVRGELIVAFVDAAGPVSEQSLRDYVKERVAAFKVPHYIFFRREEQLPRLASGKVAKYLLAAEARRELGVLTNTLSGTAAMIGVGASSFERRPQTSVLEMAADALTGALTDAGLAKEAIDGLIVQIGSPRGADYDVMAQTFGLDVKFCSQTWPHGRFTATVITHAVMAVASGLATRVACILAMKNSDIGRIGEANNPFFHEQFRENGGPHGEEAHIGMASPVAGAAMAFDLYCRRYGKDRELLAAIPLTFRRHARLTPDAVAREEMTAEDYRQSRTIIQPLRLYDCSLVGDGAVCVIVAGRAHAGGPHPPVWITGVQGIQAGRDTFIFAPRGLGVAQQSESRLTLNEARAQPVYRMAGICPEDVDVLGVYDSFSPLAVYTVEDFGFCAAGEGLDWIQHGRIGLGGDVPTNTNGGQLSHAQVNGWGQVRELILQLRGAATGRQIMDAKVAMWATVGGDAIVFQRG